MPSGKAHLAIGIGLTGITGYAIANLNGLQGLELKDFIVPLVAGGTIGALIPDIDSKKSKASQAFGKCITTAVLVAVASVLGVKYGVRMPKFTGATKQILSYFTSNIGMILFALVTVLGNLSPHRGFTHKWFGTVCYFISAGLSFNTGMFVGFIIGYLSHLLADNYLTKEKIKFFEFRLPCQKSNKKFHIVW